MAIGSTIYNFEISLSDVGRSVYETLTITLARHPSESLDYLLTRVLAYCLEYKEGIEFTKGLAEPGEPAIWVRDLTGRLTAWIEVGNPSAEKLHKAAKSVESVAIYTYKDPTILIQQLEGSRIHRAHEIQLHSFDRGFLEQLASLTDRRNTLEISVNEGELYLSIAGKHMSSPIISRSLGLAGPVL